MYRRNQRARERIEIMRIVDSEISGEPHGSRWINFGNHGSVMSTS